MNPPAPDTPDNHHLFTGRVFLEDTDALGIVYYAKYLHFTERARNEWLRDVGFAHQKLPQSYGCSFVVRKCQIRYFRPLKFDDCFLVRSSMQSVSRFTLLMEQNVYIADQCELDKLSKNPPESAIKSATALIELACIHHTSGKPQKPPADLIHRLLGNTPDGTPKPN